MIHKEIAVRLIQLLGGEDNVISAAHCATRLRLVIKDEAKIDQGKGRRAGRCKRSLFKLWSIPDYFRNRAC